MAWREVSDAGLGGGGASTGLAGSSAAPGFIGAYSPEARRRRIDKFLAKRSNRVWTKKVKYDVRKVSLV